METATRTTKTKPLLEDVKSLKDLREELRLEAHLLRAETREKLETLEKRWVEIERITEAMREESTGAATQLVGSAKEMIDELRTQYRLLKSELASKR